MTIKLSSLIHLLIADNIGFDCFAKKLVNIRHLQNAEPHQIFRMELAFKGTVMVYSLKLSTIFVKSPL